MEQAFTMYNKFMSKVIFGLTVILICVLGAAIYFDILDEKTEQTESSLSSVSEKTYKENGYVLVEIGDAVVQAEVAETAVEVTTGLSGRETLPEDTGMLFVYDEADYYAYWMPNMNFALDIIWLNADFLVIDITRNATPESFPKKFKPSKPAKYVLEVPSGYTQKKGIQIGTQAVLR